MAKIRILIATLFLVILSFISSVGFANAQAPRSYFYSNFVSTVKINSDSTLDVEEEQTYNFTGEYHQGLRFIPLDKISAIDNISVIDGQTGQPLTFSLTKLDKLSSSSWGKYTYYKNKGAQNIEWYYSAANTSHTWIIKYKVHGALGFYTDQTQLYWNVFSGFDVPINNASAEILFPTKLEAPKVSIETYRSNGTLVPYAFASDGSAVHMSAKDFAPSEALTFKLQMPEGTVTKQAYWLDFVQLYYGYAGAVLIFLTTILAAFVIWLKREKLNRGTGTVIPQYEPPENLKPAMAEAILTEQVSTKGLTATIVDLAVRGYVKIQEDDSPNLLKKLVGSAGTGILKFAGYIRFIIIGVVVLALLSEAFIQKGAGFGSVWIIIVPFLLAGIFIAISVSKNKDYNVILQKSDYPFDPELEEYEKKYLLLLFKIAPIFSTSSMRYASNIRKREIYEGMQKVKDEVYKNTQAGTQAFVVDPYKAKKRSWFNYGLLIFLTFAVIFQVKSGIAVSQGEIILAALLVCGLWLVSYIKYEARLNKQGALLKENWQGFKLYLRTAERYRLQNLTPDLFQKYLPYAMVFGIEKEWSKAFAGINVPPPSWYGSNTSAALYVGASTGGNFSSSFSPTSFSTSFSTAFSSAFASSGASGGGGGGGGGAGGGGGGGGGGAS